MQGRKETRLLTLSLAFCFLLTLVSVQAAAKSQNVIISSGCKTEYYLIKQLAGAYEAETGKKVMLGGTGNKKAMAMLEKDHIDFAFTCKPINKLKKKLKIDDAVASNWKSIPLAKDPIVIVANRQSGVTELTVSQLTAIFQGKIKNWKDLGGNDLPIVTVHIKPGMESGMLMLFKEFTVGSKGNLDPAAKTIVDPNELGRYVTKTSGAVTFMPLVAYQKVYGNIMAIDGVEPITKNVLNGQYSLSATYYLTVDKKSSEKVNHFVDYALSDMGKSIIAKSFIPIAK